MLSEAIEIAVFVHDKQKDLGGEEYILHPLRVMMSMYSIEQKIVAVLHDSFEDGPFDIEYLVEIGFSSVVVDAVEALTKRSGENYEDYIKRVSTNNVATVVKIADLEDNMNMGRLKKITASSLTRLEKYHKALLYLRSIS